MQSIEQVVTKSAKKLAGVSPHNISPDILQSKVPLVLSGFANDWPIVLSAKSSDKAVENYLRAHDIGQTLNVCELPHSTQGRVFYNEDLTGFNFTTSQETLSSALVKIASPNREGFFYVGSTSVNHYFPSMVDEIAVPALLDQSLLNIWLGNETKIAAHCDASQNLAIVASGKRRFVLFPPEQLQNLYVGPLDKAPGGQPVSLVDFKNIDEHKFPKIAKALASAQICELSAGDAIIIPKMWWHYVEGQENLNVLLNYWWNEAPVHLGKPMQALQHAIWAIRDLPKAERNAWQAQFEHYVFNQNNEEFAHINEEAKSILASPIAPDTSRKIRALLQNNLRK